MGRTGELNCQLYPVETDNSESTSPTEMPPDMVCVGCPSMNEVRNSGTDHSEKKEFCNKHRWIEGIQKL